MKNSKMVWCDESGLGRNVFAFFLRRFRLDAVPGAVPFHLFADSLYRLRVNGEICGFGPARFLPAYPEYDSYDLAPFLRAGENTVLVEINSRGAPSFQAVISRGGFIAAGGSGALDLGTPGDWRVARSDAWDAFTENFSFAIGPIENLDARRLPAGYPAFADGTVDDGAWSVPTLASEPESWGEPSPREIPMPSLEILTPPTVTLAAAVEGGRVRHGFNAANEETKVRRPFFTHLFSEAAREIELGVFWGPLYVNGVELKQTPCPELGNRQNARASLRAGWNFVYGCPELVMQCWTSLVELPDEPGLLLRARPDTGDPFAFGLGAPGSLPPGAPSSLEGLAGYPDAWTLVPDGLNACSPARELAWDRPGAVWQKDQPFVPGLELPVEGGAATVVLDFGREYLGHIVVEFETEHGTTLDVGYDERLTPHGTIAYYKTNPFVNSADRFVCGAGRQRFATFHERGGRYVQLTFRGRPGRVRLRRAEVCQTAAEVVVTGDFRCGDGLFDWLWQTGVATVRACMGDGWFDCPWRERGMYVGDVLVMAPVTRKFSADRRMERWATRLWARAQQPGGQLPDVVPSAHETPLCDYTLLWIIVLRNYWAATGDTALVREVWPAVGRIFASREWKEGEGGLWEAHKECFVFVDWGQGKDERLGTNGVLNAFRIRALECAAELAGAIDRPEEKAAYGSGADTVRAAFRRVLWDAGRGCFAACHLDGRLSDVHAPHVNALALAYGLADDTQAAGVLASVKDSLRRNTRCEGGYLELYFLNYVLEGLYRVGEAELAEGVVREHYQPLRDHGVWTIPEILKWGLEDKGSLCHGWSAAPLIYFSERILGVRDRVPGDPSQVLIAPEGESIDQASGSVPHPRGLIRVAWRVEGTELRLALEVPAGVDVHIQPAGRLAKLELVRVPMEVMVPDQRSAAVSQSTPERRFTVN